MGVKCYHELEKLQITSLLVQKKCATIKNLGQVKLQYLQVTPTLHPSIPAPLQP